MKKLLVLALVLMASGAFAQSGLGIYYDTAGTNRTNLNPSPGATISTYLVAKNIVAGGIGTWEAEIVFSPNVVFDDMIFTPITGSTNVLDAPMFAVGLWPVLATVPSINLMRIRFVMPDPVSPVFLGVGPATPSGFGTSPGYGNAASTALNVFTPVSNVPVPGRPNYYYVLSCGEASPVADSNDSWSGVKSLYR